MPNSFLNTVKAKRNDEARIFQLLRNIRSDADFFLDTGLV
jgi:hypothetical protein